MVSAACLQRTVASCGSCVIVDRAVGWIVGVRAEILSPNYDERPVGTEPGLMVLHEISLPPGEFGNGWMDQVFCNDLPREVHAFFVTLENVIAASHRTRLGQRRHSVSWPPFWRASTRAITNSRSESRFK